MYFSLINYPFKPEAGQFQPDPANNISIIMTFIWKEKCMSEF